jgi:tetratricopeptide (TPR) repeat protein
MLPVAPRLDAAFSGGTGGDGSPAGRTESDPPPRIGPYELLSPLGQGGMGIVHKAAHVQTGQVVALKTVRAPHEGRLQSLRREIHALARLRHPGIVRILDEGKEVGHRRREALCLLNLAILHDEQGRLEKSPPLFAKALSIALEVADPRIEGLLHAERSRVERRLGQLDAARESLDHAERLIEAIGDRFWLGWIRCQRGHLALAHGTSGGAFLEQARALNESVSVGGGSGLAKAVDELANAQTTFERGAQTELFHGEWIGALPEALRQRLSRS